MDYFLRKYFIYSSEFRISLYKHFPCSITTGGEFLSFNNEGDWTGMPELWNYIYLTERGEESRPRYDCRTKALRNLGSLPGVLEKTIWEF